MDKDEGKTPESSPPKSWRVRIGTWMFAIPFVMFFGAPVVVPFLGYSASEAAALIGGIVVLAEVIWFASIPLLGKEGFWAMKKKAFGFLKLKSGPVSRRTHVLGVRLLLAGLAVQLGLQAVLVVAYAIVGAHPEKVILGMNFEQQTTAYFAVLIAAIVATVIGVYLLGADFTERLKKAFEWQGEAGTEPGGRS